MRSSNKAFAAALTLLPLAACGVIGGHHDARPRLEAADPIEAAGPSTPSPVPQRSALPVADETLFLGSPYMIDGKTWTPMDVVSLDEVGYAAVLWETAEGRQTANNEAYVAGAITAAHRTLPLPSYVEVTALDTGRTILVRVNDRGPMLNDHVIALSPGAAKQLGITTDGLAAVRVRKVNPPQQEKDALREGRQAAERLETPPGLRAALVKRLPPRPSAPTGPVRTATTTNAPKPAGPVKLVAVEPAATTVPPEVERKPAEVKHSAVESPPAPVPSAKPKKPAPAPVPKPAVRTGGYVIQVAALSNREKADQLARQLGGAVSSTGKLFRVRTGPYATEAASRTAMGSIRAKGFADARLMVNDGR